MSELLHIPIDQLHINPAAQRPFSIAAARAIAKKFDATKLGIISVTPRPAGGYFVIDGQHRVGGARINGRKEPFAALLHEEMTDAEQADTFLGLNDVKLVSAVDKFRVRITRGDETPAIVARELNAYGWKVGSNAGDGWTTCIGALERLANYSPELLNRVIRIVTSAWGLERKAMRQQIVSGLGAVLKKYPALDEAHLIRSLQEVTPVQITARAASMQEVSGITIKSAMVQVIVATYNKGKRVNRLEVAA